MKPFNVYVGPVAQYLLTEYIKKDVGYIAGWIKSINAFIDTIDEDANGSQNMTIRSTRNHILGIACEMMDQDVKILGEIAERNRSYSITESVSSIVGVPASIERMYHIRSEDERLRVCDVIEFLPHDTRLVDIRIDQAREKMWLQHPVPSNEEIRETWPKWEDVIA